MASVTRQNIGLLHDKLTVNLTKEDYLPSFEKKIKEYSKTANIPGFRKGMVPAGMIKKMHGQALLTDEVLHTIEKELGKYLDKERPEIFAQPLPTTVLDQKFDYNKPEDIAFDFEIGLKPEFTLADVKNAKLTRHQVSVNDEMVSDEIARMQIKAGKMTEPELVDNDDNVINFTATESDADGNATEGGVSKENSVLLKYFSPKLQQDLRGKKVGDSITFKLGDAFEGDKLEMMQHDLGFAKDDREAADKYFTLKIDKLGLVEKRELNEEFFNEVYPGRDIKSEDELRNALREEIAGYWASQSRNQLHDQLYHFLLDETKMDFPETFLKRWVKEAGEEKKSEEQLEKDFPGFINQLRWTLISDKIIKENKLDITPEELREYMKADVVRYFGNMNMGGDMSWLDSYIDRMLKDQKQVENTYHKLITEKVFQFLESNANAAEKTVTPEELTAMQHHHHH